MKHRFVIIAAAAALSSCALPAVEHSADLPNLSPLTQSRRFAAFQNALEYGPGDQPVRWQISPKLYGSVTPIDTVRSTTDGWCRSYEELIAADPERYRLVGIACRKGPQRWMVLDAKPFAEAG